MSVETAAVDRLPWLPDEPVPMKPERRRRGGIAAGVAAALLAVAGVGSWHGYRSVTPLPGVPAPKPVAATTIQLPAARPVAPLVNPPIEREVKTARVPEVRPPSAREVRVTATPSIRQMAPEPAAKTIAPAAAVTIERPVPRAGPWEPRVASGAAGRLVQIGAFGSVRQAKQGWRYMVRAYPALSRLPAVVRPTRNSKGRTFYRFRIGTTSQAHSEVLCQRMQRIELSCAVVGLPWKAKVER